MPNSDHPEVMCMLYQATQCNGNRTCVKTCVATSCKCRMKCTGA